MGGSTMQYVQSGKLFVVVYCISLHSWSISTGRSDLVFIL